MRKILKIIFRVYMVFCTCAFTIMLVTGTVVWTNFGNINSKLVEKAVDNFGPELNGVVAGFLSTAIPGNSIQFQSIQNTKGGGLQAGFKVNDDIDFSAYRNKSNQELIAELGLNIEDIPEQIKPLLMMVKETLILDFVDKNGKPVFNREFSPEDIKELLKNGL